jgi:hypothetical protein
MRLRGLDNARSFERWTTAIEYGGRETAASEPRMSCAPAYEWGTDAMKSAFECFQHAATCEELASTANDDASRRLLLATAAQWRTLGNAAKAREQRETNHGARPKPRPPLKSGQQSS